MDCQIFSGYLYKPETLVEEYLSQGQVEKTLKMSRTEFSDMCRILAFDPFFFYKLKLSFLINLIFPPI